MAEIEHPERYHWWLNELESPGVNTLQKHGLNNHKEASDLTEETVKQTLYEDSVRLIVIVKGSETTAYNILLTR